MASLQEPSSPSSSEHEQEQALEHEEQQSQSPEQASSSSQQPSATEVSIPEHKFKRAAPQSKAKIVAHLESLVREVATAMDNNQFDITTPPWSTHFHPNFYAEVGLLANSLAKKKINLEDFCAFTAERHRANPEYRIVVTSMNTNVNTRRGKAEVFVNLELSGMPVGIVRPSVASVGLECVDGVWLFVRWMSLRGLGDMNETSW